ncbi:MAG: hypothetical protein QOJ65_504 [Fimbriimonadaceae bacterium]|jgi:ribosomal protein S18 acetylase RimI-like enzyme|nr:hypothetical protein [Fimbriimonadaceae bacterium]
MEHGTVATSEARTAALNLAHTYLELGRATGGAEVWQEVGFQACKGPMEHPICNFAVDLKVDPGVAARLREIALERRCFSVYGIFPDSDEEEHVLESHGFALSHKLQLMVCDEAAAEATPIVEAVTPLEKRKLATFMVDQFFHRQPTGFRRKITEATASSESLRLFRADWSGKTAGAVMVSEHAGVLGIYNLCVAPQFRSRGWGSAIVRSVIEIARAKGCGVTLQCAPVLASWYGSLGFKEVGSVSVFGLFRFKEIDIMGLRS